MNLYDPGEIVLAWLIGLVVAELKPSGTPFRSAKANEKYGKLAATAVRARLLPLGSGPIDVSVAI